MNAKILYTDENQKNSTWADRRWAEAAMVLMRSGHSAKFTGKSVCTRLKSNQALSRWWWVRRMVCKLSANSGVCPIKP